MGKRDAMVPELTELLAALVGIRSVNPRLQGAAAGDGEAGLADYLAQLLMSHGVSVRMQGVLEGRSNVVAHVPRGHQADDRVILLSAHMDTYPSSTGDNEYRARVEGGDLVGRGSADAKGSLAAMLHAFLSTLHFPARRESYLVASVDEEHGLCGCRAVAAAGIRADLAVTGEPTSLIPIVAQKGILRSRVHLLGDVMHAAYPSGRNAVAGVGKALSAFDRLNGELRGVFSDCGLTPATLTPTRIESDGDMNKTPRRVSIWFDARTLPGVSQLSMLHRLGELLDEVLGPGQFAMDEPYFVSPPNRCDTAHPMVAEFLAKVARAGGQGEAATFSYGSEAGYLAQIAGAALVFGPGDPKYSHGPGERISLDELARATNAFADLLVAQNQFPSTLASGANA